MVRRWLMVVALALVAGCSDEVKTSTDVFVSVDALDTARAATSVRVQVEQVVIELPVASWPLELVVLPREGRADKPFATRAWGLSQGVVVGAAQAEARFRKGERFPLELMLTPGVDVGPLPEVNTVVEPGVLIVQPSTGGDGDGDGDGGSDHPMPHGDGGVHPEEDAGEPLPVLTTAQFCERLAAPLEAWTALLARCCSADALASFKYEELIGDIGSLDTAGCNSWVEPIVAKGTLVYHGELAAACADAIVAQRDAPPVPADCPGGEGFDVNALIRDRGRRLQYIWQIPACRKAFAGTLDVSDACTDDGECIGDLMCVSSVCGLAQRAGESCASDDACAAGLFCVDGYCSSEPSGLGQSCRRTGDCIAGLRCDGVTCVELPPGSALLSSGQSCTSSFECQGYCDSDGTMLCTPFCPGP